MTRSNTHPAPTPGEIMTLDALRARLSRGYSPTVRELAGDRVLSPTRIAQQLDRLQGLGLIAREGHRARTLTLTAAGLHLLTDPDR